MVNDITLVYIGTGYTFNPETGYYTITGGSLRNPNEIDLDDGNNLLYKL